MIAKNVTQGAMNGAISKLNETYESNISFDTFKFLNEKATRIQFTLKSLDKTKKGYSRGMRACYHAHGHFFEELFKLCPEAVVTSSFGSSGKRVITKDEGNWRDANVGSIMFPVYQSEKCKCRN